MKRKHMILALTLAALMTASLFSGCGKKANDVPEDEVVESEEAGEEADADAGQAADGSDQASDEVLDDSDTDEFGREGETPPEAYPDLDGPRVEDAEVTEESKSEGLNAVPGTEVALKDSAIYGIVGETYSFPTENPHFTLSVDKIELTDKLNGWPEADRVVRITYTYNNIDLEYLMIGQYSLRMLDKDGKICQIYYFNPENDPEASMMPVEAGKSYTAAVGFILPDDSDKCTVIYDDLTESSDLEVAWEMTFE